MEGMEYVGNDVDWKDTVSFCTFDAFIAVWLKYTRDQMKRLPKGNLSRKTNYPIVNQWALIWVPNPSH